MHVTWPQNVYSPDKATCSRREEKGASGWTEAKKTSAIMYPWNPIEERKIARDIQAFADVIAAIGDVLPF